MIRLFRRRPALTPAEVQRALYAHLPNVTRPAASYAPPRPAPLPDLDPPPFYRRHSAPVVNGVRVLGRKEER